MRPLYCLILTWETEDVTEDYLDVLGPFQTREDAEMGAKDYDGEHDILGVTVAQFGFARSWAGSTKPKISA